MALGGDKFMGGGQISVDGAKWGLTPVTPVTPPHPPAPTPPPHPSKTLMQAEPCDRVTEPNLGHPTSPGIFYITSAVNL